MDSCVGKIVDLLADGVINYAKRHGAYVIRYKNKIQLLEQETKKLGEKRERIQGMVDIATNNGKVIETDVSSWLKDVEEMEGDIANFLHLQENRESFKCFARCMCPNLMWRHKMGKEANKRKPSVIELISRGDWLAKSSVAREAPFQWEPQFDSSQYYTMFNSRVSVFDKIMEALKDSGVDMIGIHGPGGAGKTTMVKEVAKEAKKLGIFDKIVIAVVSREPNTSKLQEELAPQLDLKYEQRSDSGRADELRKALLNGKKILVILDDLWQALDLNAIGIPISGPGYKCCKILLTSRREEVFKRMNVHSCFSIGYLEEEEGWELFKKVTGDFGVDELIAREVSERCGGLPIAIVAVGAALKGEEEFEWHNALHKLKNSPLKYIEGIDPMGYTPLKWSYDFLKDEDAKSCFLLCCLFPEDAEIDIDDLVRYSFALGFLKRVDTLKVARSIVQAVVKKLKKSCLLLNGAKKNFVKVHDVIRDLAISITEEKQAEHGGGHDWPGQQQFIVDHDIRKWPKNDAWKHHTAISLKINDDNFPFPSSMLNCPLVHTLVLERVWETDSSHRIPNDFFQGTKEVRVLDFKSISLELPSSILELDHLRMLCLGDCKLLGDLTTIRNLKYHIEILSFEGSMIEELPQEIGELTRLRSLNLTMCRWLKVIPKGVISNLIHLEELYAIRSFKGWDTTIDCGRLKNASIAELKSLTQLTILHVNISAESSRIMVQECPNLFEKLTNFAIHINIPRSYYDPTLNVLKIVDIHHIDGEFHPLMDKVNSLWLIKISHLKGKFKDPKDLSIHGHQDLRFLLGKPQQQFTLCGGRTFSMLTDLRICECNGIKYIFLPTYARALQQLEHLCIINCSNMEQIIGVVDHDQEEEVIIDEVIIFSRLVGLRLGALPQFRGFYPEMEKTTIEGNLSNSTTAVKSIFNEKVSFPALKDLTMHDLSVEGIWNKQAIQFPKRSNEVSFSQLSIVHVSNCDNLVNVFPSNMLPRLQNLEELKVKKCLSLTSLVEDLNLNIQSPMLSNGDHCSYDDSVNELKELRLEDLPNLRSFYEFKSEPPYLLNYQDVCPNMETLCLGDWKGTRGIQLWDLATTWEHLQDVILIGCQVLTKVLSHHLKRSFRMIHLQNCQGLQYVIDLDDTISIDEEQFVDVERLKLYDLLELVSLWNKNLREIEHLRNLKYINIRNCPQMKSLLTHSMATTLQHLKKLVVESCETMEEIISIEENSINIAEEEKTSWQIEFLKLEYLILIDLPNLKSFCDDGRGSFSFLLLRGVSVKNCPKMKTFVSGQICLLPRMMRAVVGVKEVEITNLNAYFETRNEDSNHMRKIIYWRDGIRWDELRFTGDYWEIKEHMCK